MKKARRVASTEKSYFDDESDEEVERKSEGVGGQGGDIDETIRGGEEEEEVDPLDAFMVGVEETRAEENKCMGKEKEKPGYIDQLDSLDPVADYEGRFAARQAEEEEREKNAANDAVDADLLKQEQEHQRVPTAKKHMEVLPPADHSTIEYEPFIKNLYTPHPEVARLSDEDVHISRDEMEIAIVNKYSAKELENVPAPIVELEQAGFPKGIMEELKVLGVYRPTPIQAQAWPVALSGRDVIGVAKTGSGKTFGYVLPLLVHVMDQREICLGEGPIGLILAPTRELATQIYNQSKKFTRKLGAKVCAIFGGSGKYEMQKALKEGPEIIVATPGRMIEMLKLKATNLKRCTMLIVDEADRMFDLGFEPQVRSIAGQIRPDRQSLLFSATFKRKVQGLAQDLLYFPVRITIGSDNLSANADIHQIVTVVGPESEKWGWLTRQLPMLVNKGRVLVFVSSKAGCEQLCLSIKQVHNVACESIHGDKEQTEREKALNSFKSGKCMVLVGTEVAARGLDIKDIKSVINYDAARSVESHIHRIGRTGRMQKDGVHPGTAYTLLTDKQSKEAKQLIPHLKAAGQVVSDDLRNLAGNVFGGRNGKGGKFSAVAPPPFLGSATSSSSKRPHPG